MSSGSVARDSPGSCRRPRPCGRTATHALSPRKSRCWKPRRTKSSPTKPSGTAPSATTSGRLRRRPWWKLSPAASPPKRIGVEFSSFSLHFQRLTGERVDIEPALYQLRRRKDPDELARLRKAIAGLRKMYALARQIIEPGITELEVFNRLQAAAVDEIGEKMSDHPTATTSPAALGADRPAAAARHRTASFTSSISAPPAAATLRIPAGPSPSTRSRPTSSRRRGRTS